MCASNLPLPGDRDCTAPKSCRASGRLSGLPANLLMQSAACRAQTCLVTSRLKKELHSNCARWSLLHHAAALKETVEGALIHELATLPDSYFPLSLLSSHVLPTGPSI